MSVQVVTSLAEALDALGALPGALVLAGGTDLMVEMNSGHRHVDAVISIGRVGELRTWRYDPDASTVHLGAGITYGEIGSEPLASLLPALAQAARTVGSPQIRNAATIGGNVATSSPAGDGLPVLAALEAQIHLASSVATRTVAFADFATGPKRTVIQPGELITGVTVPVLAGYQGYSKVGVRNAMVIATASACLATDAPTRSIRLALGSVGPVILRSPEAEAYAADAVDFESASASAATVAEFATLAAQSARPIDDHRSTADYRRHAIHVLAARLLRRAFPNV